MSGFGLSAAQGLAAEVSQRVGTLGLSISTTVPAGETLVVLGPNGAGKTTFLRALAGFVEVESGRIEIGGKVVFESVSAIDMAPDQRPIGYMFQDYLLFPHMSVLENVAFGPRSRGASRSHARAEAAEWLDRLDVGSLGLSRSSELSGGQAQRVALARALVTVPELLLLDEPLSALDVSTREATRRTLRRELDGFKGAAVVVTHDPVDAFALADRVLVLEEGQVTQQGELAEVTSKPRTPYVADLLGVNLIRGVAKGHQVDSGTSIIQISQSIQGDVLVLIAPQSISLHSLQPSTSARNVWPMRVDSIDTLGPKARVAVSGALDLVVEVTAASAGEMGLAEGSAVWASVKATEVVVYKA